MLTVMLVLGLVCLFLSVWLLVGSTGIEHMWVNGVATRRDGTELPDVRPGRLLRS